MWTQIRPQILAAMVMLSIITVFAIHHGLTEIAVGAVTGIVGLGNRILESMDKS